MASAASAASVADRPPDGDEAVRELRARVDKRLEDRWHEEGVDASPNSEDAEFLRRVYLDVLGRIPRVSEARDFLADTRDDLGTDWCASC